METEGKRFALLLAARDSEYVKNLYGGYFNVFKSAFEEEGEEWELFRVVEGEFPDMDDLDKYDGFVISGSPYDAYGNETWIIRLCFLLQVLDAMEKKVLGICFGHQVICRALGGKVGKANGGWDLGIRKVRIVKEMVRPCSFLGDETPTSMAIIECHQDEVWEVPTDAQVIAFSKKTGVEMFTIGDHILGIQGHPEYNKGILLNLIERLLRNNSIDEEIAENAVKAMEMAEPDKKRLETMCRNFLKGKRDLISSITY